MGAIQTTRWSIVLQAAASDQEVARAAVRWLCEAYWYPMYLYYRLEGCSRDDALDLVQGLFADLIEGNDFVRADPARGRFRDYLLGAARHRRLNARRRDGREIPLEITTDDGETRFLAEPISQRTPEDAFIAAWAREVIDRVLQELGVEYKARGEFPLYRRLVSCMIGGDDATYAAVATEHQKAVGAVKMAAMRLRTRFAKRLREHVASYTPDDEVDDELRSLLAALGEEALV